MDKEKLEHLAKLARIELPEGKEDKLLRDAENILGYFDELKDLNTDDIEPMIGGTDTVNAAREDERSEELLRGGIEAFPISRDGYLEVPAVIKEMNTDL